MKTQMTKEKRKRTIKRSCRITSRIRNVWRWMEGRREREVEATCWRRRESGREREMSREAQRNIKRVKGRKREVRKKKYRKMKSN